MIIHRKNSLDDASRTDADKVMIKRLTVLVIILLLLVSISSCTIGYLIGKSVNLDRYTGRIIDTITITSGRPKGEQPSQVYRIIIRGRVLYTDGSPYRNGTIELRSEVRYTTTDKNGWFMFDDVSVGRHRVSVMEDGVVLAYCDVIIERSIYLTSATRIRLDDGSYLIQIPLDIPIIELMLKLDKDRSKLDLKDVRERKTDDSGGTKQGDPTDGPGEPADPGIPDIPEIPDDPEVLEGPEEPITPEEPDPSDDSDDSGGSGQTGKAPYIIVTDDINPSKAWTKKTAVDIFAERPGNTGVRTIDGKSVIAPGAKGMYIFRIENSEAGPVEYRIRLSETDRNNPPLQMEYRLKRGVSGDEYIGGDSWKSAKDIAVNGDRLAAGEDVYYTLEWKWDSGDDALDTAIGSQKEIPPYILEIIINAKFE